MRMNRQQCRERVALLVVLGIASSGCIGEDQSGGEAERTGSAQQAFNESTCATTSDIDDLQTVCHKSGESPCDNISPSGELQGHNHGGDCDHAWILSLSNGDGYRNGNGFIEVYPSKILPDSFTTRSVCENRFVGTRAWVWTGPPWHWELVGENFYQGHLQGDSNDGLCDFQTTLKSGTADLRFGVGNEAAWRVVAQAYRCLNGTTFGNCDRDYVNVTVDVSHF